MNSLRIPKVNVSRQSSLASVQNYPSLDEVELENLLREEGLEKFDDKFEEDAISLSFEETDSDNGEFSGSQVRFL